MLGYALEAMRANPNCNGGLFWMYDDCWGEIGWTILDYGLRRKPAWYAVRRAFAPVRLILRPAGEHHIRVMLANDQRVPFQGELEYGYVSLDGSVRDLQRMNVNVPPLGRSECAVFARGAHDPTRGLWIARFPGLREIDPAIFRAVDMRQLKTTRASLGLQATLEGENTARVFIRSDVYAHAVQLSLPNNCQASDNYFDLLPGEEREVIVRLGVKHGLEAIQATCVNQ
jgi:beta-mannosidase